MTLSWGAQPPPAPVLRRLKLADAPAASDLAQLMGWSHGLADWERILRWGGEGCFCLTEDERLISTVTTVPYGKDRAWIGMVLTHPDHRRRGYARQVMQAAVAYLNEQGVQHIMLDATETARPLYEGLGFRRLYDIEVWQGRASGYLGSQARPLRQDDLPAVVDLDAEAFGVARPWLIKQLVEEFPRMGWVDTREGVIEGFVLAQQRANVVHIGPWIHRSPWGAEKLLRTAMGMLLGNEVRLEIPDPNSHASTFAWNYGLRRQRHCTRMIYGDVPAPQENLQDLYGVASFATG